MEIKGGAVLFARQILDSEIFVLKPPIWFKIWFYIISKANYEDKGVFKRGELFTSYKKISAETGGRRDTIDKFIRWAKSSDMVATRKTTRGMFIKVLKYDEFQKIDTYQKRHRSDRVDETKAKQKRNAGDTIQKKEKKEKKETTACAVFVQSNSSEGKIWDKSKDSKAFIGELVADDRASYRIVGRFFEAKKVVFPSKEIAEKAFNRNIRAATELAEYTPDERSRAVGLASKRTKEWTLETVIKYLQK